jgi:hypothetical protein
MVIFVQIIIILILFTFLAFFLTQLFNILFRGFAPFIATRKKIIDKIISELEVNDETIIYELGCGQAGFLRAMHQKYPKNKLVGVEYATIPYLIGQIQNSFTGSKLKLIKKNIFAVDINEADIIYCYLNRDTMVTLEKKFQVECRQGTVIVSYNFLLPNTEAYKTLEVGKTDKVYFYKM